ncbi:MAG: hypothetical protein J6W95_03245 [Bacteroidales bacterium]|nr:hypothetical protein [Bacteroidales bacterium]
MILDHNGQSQYYTLQEATFYLTDEEGNKTKWLYINEDRAQGDNVWSYKKHFLHGESYLFITNDPGLQPKAYQDSTMTNGRTSRNGGADDGYVETDWYYPTRFIGKKLTVSVEGQIRHNGGQPVEYKKELGVIDFPQALQVYDPSPGYEKADYGLLVFPVVCDRNINYIDVSYKDSLDIVHQLPRITLTGNSNYSSFVKIPAHEAHKDLTITANILSASWEKGPAQLGRSLFAHRFGGRTLTPRWRPARRLTDVDNQLLTGLV